MIVSDIGTKLTSNAVLAWQGVDGIEWHYIAPASDAEWVRRELKLECAMNCSTKRRRDRSREVMRVKINT